jgi:FkbM family methyltransferase
MKNDLKLANNCVSKIKKTFNKRENQIIEIDNFKFYLDEKDSLGLRNAVEFEPEVLKSLKKYVNKDSNILDVGANLGYFTAHMSRLVGANGVVHAFEPEPGNFLLLEKNVRANNLDNVITHKIALGESDKTGELFINEFSNGMHRLYESVCCGTSKVEVQIKALDSLFSPGNISLIKIDVEGFEPFVLLGAEKIIRNNDVVVISEYCPPSMIEANASVTKFIDYLRNCKLKAYTTEETIIDWDVLYADARKWESYGRDRFINLCHEKTNLEIASIVQKVSLHIGCSRPFIENIVFKA